MRSRAGWRYAAAVMCRLFGFRARAPSAVHRSLVLESNALMRQSRAHPDGWGLAWYVDGQPQLARKAMSAFADTDFEQLCQFVSSETVIAHVRKASVGALVADNTHPFTYGSWTFAHNGHLPGFDSKKARFEAPIDGPRRAAMRGDTDSERMFALFLSELARKRPQLGEASITVDEVQQALVTALAHVDACCADEPEAPACNVVVSNGRLLVAYRRGRPLHFSTHKRRCPERDTCSAFAGRCESPTPPGLEISHLVISSEPLGDQDVWQELGDGELVAVDDQMRLHRHVLAPLCADARPFTRGGVH